MKTALSTLICLFGLLTSTSWCNEFPEYTLSDIVQEDIKQCALGEWQGIVRIDPGEKVPFTLSLAGSVLALREQPEPFIIEALQTVYIKVDKNTFTFSTDKATWKTFEEQFGGETGVSLGISDEGGPFGSIYAELNPK